MVRAQVDDVESIDREIKARARLNRGGNAATRSAAHATRLCRRPQIAHERRARPAQDGALQGDRGVAGAWRGRGVSQARGVLGTLAWMMGSSRQVRVTRTGSSAVDPGLGSLSGHELADIARDAPPDPAGGVISVPRSEIDRGPVPDLVVSGTAPTAICPAAAEVLAEIIRDYLATHNLGARDLEDFGHDQPPCTPVRRLHPHQHRRSAVA
jgi:hypothetical protein